MSITSPAFFYLVPEDEIASQIISIPVNAPFKYTRRDGKKVFRIGADHTPKTPGQLISFGSDPACCDILMPQGSPPKQCHFFLNPRTGELLLRDDTEDGATWLTHSNPAKFSLPEGRQRQRVVPTTEEHAAVAMQSAKFDLVWSEPKRAFAIAKANFIVRQISTGKQERIYQCGQIVHSRIRELGQGATAKVFLTIDLNTGDHLAVKTFLRQVGRTERDINNIKHFARLEIKTMSKLSHVRIELL